MSSWRTSLHIILIGLFVPLATHAFSSSWSDRIKSLQPSYTDHWLFDFHQHSQHEKQSITNSLAPWNEQLEQDHASILEWQESFQRNGLADFTPPMTTAGMKCLMIGQDVSMRNPQQRNHFETKLPWEDEPEAEITSLIVSQHTAQHTTDSTLSIEPAAATSTNSLVKSPTQPSSSSSQLQVSKEAAIYDCIVDQGLLNAVLHQPEQAREFLLEAGTVLREHGIYVLSTTTLTKKHRGMLTSWTSECGLEWQFELDGISGAQGQVSVARRFNTGAMPNVGKLSRLQP